MSEQEVDLDTQIGERSIAEMWDDMREKPSKTVPIIVGIASAILIAMFVFMGMKPM